jgi:hypothetical protein
MTPIADTFSSLTKAEFLLALTVWRLQKSKPNHSRTEVPAPRINSCPSVL